MSNACILFQFDNANIRGKILGTNRRPWIISDSHRLEMTFEPGPETVPGTYRNFKGFRASCTFHREGECWPPFFLPHDRIYNRSNYIDLSEVSVDIKWHSGLLVLFSEEVNGGLHFFLLHQFMAEFIISASINLSEMSVDIKFKESFTTL